MPPLRELQQDFQNFLLGDDTAIESQIVSTPQVSAAKRLGVYSNAYVARLIEALESSYPALAKLLGPEDFSELCETYVRAQPSRFFSIRHYGATLAEFLKSYPDYESVAVLAELARWEWLMADVFDAADQLPIRAHALQTVQPDHWADLRFDWHPTVRRIDLSWNAPQLWRALTRDQDRPEMVVSEPAIAWLAWRQDLSSQYRSLPAIEATAFDAAHAGKSFGDLCELLCEHHDEDEAPTHAAAFLSQWLNAGLITSLR
jgi:hypothetical protein